MAPVAALGDSFAHVPTGPGNAIERATGPEVRVLFELAGQLEASVQGPVKQNLVRQLIMTLAALSRTLQGQNNPTSYPTEPGPDVSAYGPDYVPVAGKSPRWAGLLAELTAAGARAAPMVAVVDRDADFRTAMCRVLEAEGLTVAAFATCDLFLRAQTSGGPACLIIDSSLPGMSGLQLLRTLGDQGHALPVIVVAGPSEVPTAVRALKAGAVDFLEKPNSCDVLMTSVERALVRGLESEHLNLDHEAAASRLHDLTPRQRQVMDLILAGHPNKNIAADIGVSQRTVESHRAEVMRKTGARSMPALARLAAAAVGGSTAPLSFDFGPTVGQT